MTRFALHHVSLLLALSTSASTLLAQPVVDGAAADKTLGWRLEKRWSIGGATDPTLELKQVFPRDVLGDAKGHLWLVDAASFRVVEYDANGRLVRSLGRRGQGPGEFEFPTGINFLPDGTIRVDDLIRRVFVRYSPAGAPLADERQSTPRLQSVQRLDDQLEVGLRATGDSSWLMTRRNERTKVLAVWARPTLKTTPPVCGLSDYPARPVFDAPFAWTARGRTIAFTHGEFRITVLNGDTPVRILSRRSERRVSNEAMARTQLGKGAPVQVVGRPVCYVPPDMVIKTAGIASKLPAYADLTTAPDGRIWATRFAVRGESRMADIYHPVNGYEGTVALGTKQPVTFLSDGSLVSLEADDDDVPLVVVYRITR